MGETTLESKIAKHIVAAEILKLNLKTKDFKIDIDTHPDGMYFEIKGNVNNFNFEYSILSFRHKLKATKDQHTIEIDTEGQNSEKIDGIRINDRYYGTTERIRKDLKDVFQHLQELLTERIDYGAQTTDVIEQIRKEKQKEIGELGEYEKNLINAFAFAETIFHRIKKEIKEKVPEFFAIIDKYYRGEYNPTSQMPVQFETTEDAINSFELK